MFPGFAWTGGQQEVRRRWCRRKGASYAFRQISEGIIKRRTVANEACDSGRVMLNDKIARASAEVKVGDVIEVAFGTKAVKVRVTSVQETIRKEDTKEMFEYI